jgi:hypothetical protein
MAVAVAALPWIYSPTVAAAKDRTGRFAISGAISWGLISPDDINRQIQFDNLSSATAVDDITSYTEAVGELRYGVSNRLTLETQLGYLWQDKTDGRVTRKVIAFPLTLNLAFFLIDAKSRSLSVLAGGGILLNAKYTGEDPLGGFSYTGTGYSAQAALEFEQFLSDLWAARLRAQGQLAGVSDILPDGGSLDLSGGAIQLGLRAYFR